MKNNDKKISTVTDSKEWTRMDIITAVYSFLTLIIAVIAFFSFFIAFESLNSSTETANKVTESLKQTSHVLEIASRPLLGIKRYRFSRFFCENKLDEVRVTLENLSYFPLRILEHDCKLSYNERLVKIRKKSSFKEKILKPKATWTYIIKFSPKSWIGCQKPCKIKFNIMLQAVYSNIDDTKFYHYKSIEEVTYQFSGTVEVNKDTFNNRPLEEKIVLIKKEEIERLTRGWFSKDPPAKKKLNIIAI